MPQGLRRFLTPPQDTAEPGDTVCWAALWHQRGCRSPGHGMAGFPGQGRCQRPIGLSCPWICQSLLSVAAFSSAWCCGRIWKVAARGARRRRRRRTGAPFLRWSLGRQVGPRHGGGVVPGAEAGWGGCCRALAGAELWCQGSGRVAAVR